MVWFENHVVPNMINRELTINGEMQYWFHSVLTHIDEDVQAGRNHSMLFMLTRNPERNNFMEVVRVDYEPLKDAEFIRSFITAPV